MKIPFSLQMALDGSGDGVMVYRNEDHKLTMTITTPKGKGGYETPIKTYRFDGDEREYTGAEVLKIIEARTKALS